MIFSTVVFFFTEEGIKEEGEGCCGYEVFQVNFGDDYFDRTLLSLLSACLFSLCLFVQAAVCAGAYHCTRTVQC